jgi:ABC-type branched-subunit amino acid transport system permease subunit
MDQSGIGCPNCGFKIAPTLVPASPTSSFFCPRCHKELTTVAPDQAILALLSALVAIASCLAFGLRGSSLFLTAAVFGVGAYLCARFIRAVIAVPRLRSSGSK